DGKTPREKETYQEGKRHGIRYTYFPSGNTEKEETYKFDLLAGPSKTYYPSGELASVVEYRNNRRIGLFTAYYPDKTIKEQGEYVADKKHKEWKQYDETGKLVTTIIYKAGVVINTIPAE